MAALANAVLVPATNIRSILVLTPVRPPRPHPAPDRADCPHQPLVLACAVGLLLNLTFRTRVGAALGGWPGTHLLIVTSSTLLEVLGQAALPVGLLCVGAGLRAPAARAEVARVLGWALVLRLVLVPAATLELCRRRLVPVSALAEYGGSLGRSA